MLDTLHLPHQIHFPSCLSWKASLAGWHHLAPLTSGIHSHLAARRFWEVVGAGEGSEQIASPGSSRVLAVLPSFESSSCKGASSLLPRCSQGCFPALTLLLLVVPSGMLMASLLLTQDRHALVDALNSYALTLVPSNKKYSLFTFSPQTRSSFLCQMFGPIESGRNDVAGPQETCAFDSL